MLNICGAGSAICAPEVYELYVMARAHFDPDSTYDGLRCCFMSRRRILASGASSKFKSSQYACESLATKFVDRNHGVNYAIANIIEGNKYVREWNDNSFYLWQSRISSFTYRFKCDMIAIENAGITLDELLKYTPGKGAKIYYLDNISKESKCGIDIVLGYSESHSKLSERHDDDPLGVIRSEWYPIYQYTQILKKLNNRTKLTQILKDIFL